MTQTNRFISIQKIRSFNSIHDLRYQKFEDSIEVKFQFKKIILFYSIIHNLSTFVSFPPDWIWHITKQRKLIITIMLKLMSDEKNCYVETKLKIFYTNNAKINIIFDISTT